MKNVSRKSARRRALRAAQVVTLGLALAGGGGCYAQHDPGPDPDLADATIAMDDAGQPLVVADADVAPPDAAVDVGPEDAGLSAADSGSHAMADAAMMTGCIGAEDWGACCDEIDWSCDGENSWGCCAWGPYSPPEEGALPTPRSVSQRVVA
ncbi:MAG: hypothetical protein JRH11_01315 [Deltaproteobacteria bacterium]|nr:hypothetical protein [Deltaproteobacteria bacterium]